ncbi:MULTISPECIES: carboxypeptidase-like regulatory domain-containing protein [unclassified Archaeoglobus]|uniref:carboxypeptidase-like regulatory domain-containing protein n=1 Tax=unclassified Archaeoglobus TaxID=2643606 RepID=UPI0025C296A9|nr:MULTISPECIES: carboxypeptidase-like regulatory domain-containing protein [unclassified Archaeoglobus]
MESKMALAAVAIGFLTFVVGFGYYFGWWDQLYDYIPWFADKGDLKVTVYDAKQTADTSDDVPLANVTVSILSTELVKKTDENGTAYFSDVDVGDYQVQAEWGSNVLAKNVTITKDAIATLTFLFNESAS